MENTAKGKIITIVGGNGAMGQLFKRYWDQSGATVYTIGRNDWADAHKFLNRCDPC
jgi:prephenate dehydrogenase